MRDRSERKILRQIDKQKSGKRDGVMERPSEGEMEDRLMERLRDRQFYTKIQIEGEM